VFDASKSLASGCKSSGSSIDFTSRFDFTEHEFLIEIEIANLFPYRVLILSSMVFIANLFLIELCSIEPRFFQLLTISSFVPDTMDITKGRSSSASLASRISELKMESSPPVPGVPSEIVASTSGKEKCSKFDEDSNQTAPTEGSSIWAESVYSRERCLPNYNTINDIRASTQNIERVTTDTHKVAKRIKKGRSAQQEEPSADAETTRSCIDLHRWSKGTATD